MDLAGREVAVLGKGLKSTACLGVTVQARSVSLAKILGNGCNPAFCVPHHLGNTDSVITFSWCQNCSVQWDGHLLLLSI